MFTRLKDYKRLISNENLGVIIDQDSSLLRQMELTAQEELEGYLRHHFDTALMFAGFASYSPTVAYSVGDLISYVNSEDDLFICAIDTAAGENPVSDPTKWTKGDNRNQYLLTIFIDITLYHAHSRINPRNIPEFRIERYRDAIQWLKSVNSGKISPAFPKLAAPTVLGLNVHYGTTKKDTNTY